MLFSFIQIAVLTAGLAGDLPAGADGDARASLLAVMQRTVDPEALRDGLEARIEAEALSLEAAMAPDAPTLGWQSEGVGSSFGREANAVDYLRFSADIDPPWLRRERRALRGGIASWTAAAERAVLLDAARISGQAWLTWAAAEAELALTERRLARVERALTLLAKRFELGEVAGAEVEQLRLEQARDAGAGRRARARIESLAAALEARIGGPLETPGTGALEALVTSLGAAMPAAKNFGTAEFAAADTGTAGAAAPTAALRARAAAEVARAALERRLAWGRPTAEVEWERVPSIDGISGFDALGFHLALPLPLGRRGRAVRALSEVSATAAEADRVLGERQIASRRAAARAERQAAAATLSELGAILARMPATEHSLAEQFRLGAISYLVLIDGLSRLDDVRREAIEARRDLLAARLELAILEDDPTLFPLPDLEAAP